MHFLRQLLDYPKKTSLGLGWVLGLGIDATGCHELRQNVSPNRPLLRLPGEVTENWLCSHYAIFACVAAIYHG